MFMQILTNTPKWVFALFAGLVYLGLKQMLSNRASLNRITIMPLAMTVLSLYGVTSVFGDSPHALLTWVAGAAVAFTLNFQIASPTQIQYDAASRSFQLPGSAVPLALFMGIFFTKYAVGISMGMQPALAHNSSFALVVGGLYGAFSGIFLSRAAKLWRIALAQANVTSLVTTS
jgi:hypothetical protein